MLILHQIGPGVSVQDGGRPGFLAQGLSCGGAADKRALNEAAALLGQRGAALEMAGFGGVFEVTRPARIALTGAPMRADIDGAPLVWQASHRLKPGQKLTIGPAISGVYGYLSIGGGIDTPKIMGARARHHIAGLGRALQAGQSLPLGEDDGSETGLEIAVSDRFSGGQLRVVDSAQTAVFDPDLRDAFFTGKFTRGKRGNRQGVAIDTGVARFPADDGLSVLSELIVPGDIQMTGDGQPFVLLSECQTTGGYPRIGTVILPDLPLIAQAAPGASISFVHVSHQAAVAAMLREATEIAGLRSKVAPMIRDPHRVNLLNFNLISGAIAGGTQG